MIAGIATFPFAYFQSCLWGVSPCRAFRCRLRADSSHCGSYSRTCGTALWEPEHAGAAAIARSVGLNLYWNAPMRDDDMQTQISLIEKSVDRGMAGIIVSPIQTLPMRTPIRRVLAQGVPVVVIDSELGIHRDQARLRIERRTRGWTDRRAQSWIDPSRQGEYRHCWNPAELNSNTVRERSFESTLNSEFPGIRIVARRLGLASVPQEQHNAEELLAGGESLDAIVALSLAATRGTTTPSQNLARHERSSLWDLTRI